MIIGWFPFAENAGLELTVSLTNDPKAPSIAPAPFPPHNFDPSIPIDILTSTNSNNGDCYLIGNITFVCKTNQTEAEMDTVYFKYSFNDGNNEPYTTSHNVTHSYDEVGVYNYTVDAVAKNGSKAFHAAHSGQIHVLGKNYKGVFWFVNNVSSTEPVSAITMYVNKDNRFEANVESHVKISAVGS